MTIHEKRINLKRQILSMERLKQINKTRIFLVILLFISLFLPYDFFTYFVKDHYCTVWESIIIGEASAVVLMIILVFLLIGCFYLPGRIGKVLNNSYFVLFFCFLALLMISSINQESSINPEYTDYYSHGISYYLLPVLFVLIIFDTISSINIHK